MVRGIETLLMEDDNTFLKNRYWKIKEIYDEPLIKQKRKFRE